MKVGKARNAELRELAGNIEQNLVLLGGTAIEDKLQGIRYSFAFLLLFIYLLLAFVIIYLFIYLFVYYLFAFVPFLLLFVFPQSDA
jgi:hypothetical protein